MKKLFFIGLILCICCVSWAKIDKSNLRILYVGGSGNIETSLGIVDSVAFRKDVQERMASYENMLKQYFNTVEVIHAGEYFPELSARYDVTVMDGIPDPILPAYTNKDSSGRVIDFKRAGYLPEDFDRPMVMIADMGERLGRRIGLKTDWYCLCLDADAHHFRAEHPIFHRPFPVKITVRMKPTPSDAYHYAYYLDGPMPDSIPMWQVQTKGYMTHEGFRVGMVSRPWGFEDSPDAEYISSGVCAKTLDAVAIGRHGNFLHWGFSASPADMTEEAKAVFANAIVYIADFAGQKPIARKFNDRIATRDYLKEKKYLSTRQAWQERLKWDKQSDKEILQKQKNVLAKKERGEKLLPQEEGLLDYTPQKPISYVDFVKRYQKEEFDRFGTDEKAYAAYYDHNRAYFYGGKGMYTLTIDEDVKSLGIPNNDLRLLDVAIGMLEKGQEAEKANRILSRYTLCRFSTPQEWREWFEANKKRLFFTEAGGWLFLVNSRDAMSGNDYHVRDVQPQTRQLPEIKVTDDKNPVQVAVGLGNVANGNIEIVVRMKIHNGYHIYANVSKLDPFIPTTIEIKLPEGYRPVGKLQKPSFKSFNDRGTTIYEDEAVFRQEISGSGKGEIHTKIGYQCCDTHICMPPTEIDYVVQIK